MWVENQLRFALWRSVMGLKIKLWSFFIDLVLDLLKINASEGQLLFL